MKTLINQLKITEFITELVVKY